MKNGGASIEAVEAVIKILEDNPLFNAGIGAVLNSEGNVELDASIMDGKTLQAGAVAGVTTIKNPISAALRVMTATNHVMLIGKGAEKFALEQKLEIVDPAYFVTEKQLENLRKIREKENAVLDKKGLLALWLWTDMETLLPEHQPADWPIKSLGVWVTRPL